MSGGCLSSPKPWRRSCPRAMRCWMRNCPAAAGRWAAWWKCCRRAPASMCGSCCCRAWRKPSRRRRGRSCWWPRRSSRSGPAWPRRACPASACCASAPTSPRRACGRPSSRCVAPTWRPCWRGCRKPRAPSCAACTWRRSSTTSCCSCSAVSMRGTMHRPRGCACWSKAWTRCNCTSSSGAARRWNRPLALPAQAARVAALLEARKGRAAAPAPHCAAHPLAQEIACTGSHCCPHMKTSASPGAGARCSSRRASPRSMKRCCSKSPPPSACGAGASACCATWCRTASRWARRSGRMAPRRWLHWPSCG